MSEDVEEMDEEEGGKKTGGKKIILIILLPILLLGGAGAGLFFSGLLDPLLGIEAEEGEEGAEAEPEPEEIIPPEPAVYVDLEEMLVTLRSTGAKQKFLKLSISLELDKPEDQTTIDNVMPRIIDNFQVFLRELRLEELEGSQGVYRVKEELLDRVNQAVAPVKVKDVLFRDLLIQ